MCYGLKLENLWEVLAENCWEWANQSPQWAAYCAMLANCLVPLDKQPGMHPVGFGESYHRLFAKYVLKVAGNQATAAASNFNLCVGLQLGIKATAHAANHPLFLGEQPLDNPCHTHQTKMPVAQMQIAL